MLTKPYRILTSRGYRGFLCLVCSRLSWNLHDLVNHYCPHCHQFLDDLPDDLRVDAVEGQAPGLLALVPPKPRAVDVLHLPEEGSAEVESG